MNRGPQDMKIALYSSTALAACTLIKYSSPKFIESCVNSSLYDFSKFKIITVAMMLGD